MRGLNLRPPACKAGALPAELITHKSVQSQYYHAATELYMKNPVHAKWKNCTNADLTYVVTRTGIEPMIPP